MRLRIPTSAVFLCALLAGQETTPTFRSDVNWVRVDLEVLKGAAAVTDLTAADFVVKDNGKAMPVLRVTREEALLDLVLLFDMSGSMKEGVAEVASAAKEALAQLRKGDRVAVAGFNDGLIPVLAFSDDLKEVEQAIRFGIVPQPFRGGTELHAAVMKSARLLAKEPSSERRRAVLVVTDNQGEKGVSDDEVTERLWKTDTVLCGLMLESTDTRKNRPGVSKPASRSGCEMREALNPARDFAEMMKRLRNRYVVYYTMPEGKPGEQREIEVELTKAARTRVGEARILARKGYLLPGGAE
jgi:Mg-chelatase subunit ChlD